MSTQQLFRSLPDIASIGDRLLVDVGDCEVRILAAVQNPDIMVLESLLSPYECQAIIKAAEPRLSRSTTVNADTGGSQVHAARTSDGMFFKRGEIEVIGKLEARIAKLLRWPVENGEGMQILRYGPGAEYKPHYDYFDPTSKGSETNLKRGGQRVATLIMYLNEPEAGGATVFPEVPLAVLPKVGSAVFFRYPQATPASRSIHGGAAVSAGVKWVATKWLRESIFI